MKHNLELNLNTELGLLPVKKDCQRVLEAAIRAPVIKAEQKRIPLNLALVIDRSGSMGGEKLGYAQQAACQVLDLLEKNDLVSIVAYDNEIITLSPAVNVLDTQRKNLKDMVMRLTPRGSTNLGDGWLTGGKLVADAQLKDGLNRVLLLTDGLANNGITDLEELGMHAREVHSRGISTSTFGIGLDYNEHLLEHMANQGGGNFHYVDSPARIPELLLAELKNMLSICARSVELTLEIPGEVKAEVLGGWKTERQTDKLILALGDLTSGQNREVYINLIVPGRGEGRDLVIKGAVRGIGMENELFEQAALLTFRVVSEEELVKTKPDKALMKRYSLVAMADATLESLRLERLGRTRESGDHLAFYRLRYSPNMAEPDIERYRNMEERLRHGMDEQDRKLTHRHQYEEKQRRPTEDRPDLDTDKKP